MESKIQTQAMEDKATGATQGMRMRKRTSRRPRKGVFRIRARVVASTMTIPWEIRVKTRVFRRARRKMGSPTTRAKFRNPTNWKERLPAVLSLTARMRARMKGIPTRTKT